MTLGTTDRPVEILVVEDNPGDARLVQETIKESEYQTNITIAEDGEIAMAYLRKEGEHADASRPDLVALDLAMPKKDGYEVLAEMGADPALRRIPVMILTSTQAERDRLHSQQVGPSRYCTKPLPLERFNAIISQLRDLEALDPRHFGQGPPRSQ